MDEAVLASYQRQIIRRCLPQRHRQRTILEQFVLTVAPAMVWAFAFCGALFGILVISASFKKAYAHSSWISKGEHSWCCGPQDCKAVDPKDVAVVDGGYLVRRFNSFTKQTVIELIPYEQALPSERERDGTIRYVICSHPEGARKCFFAPQPGS